MTTKIRLVQGDTRPQLRFAVTDPATGTPIDFSDGGVTVRFKFRAAGASATKETLMCSKMPGFIESDGTINTNPPYNVPGAGGRVVLNWGPDSLDTTGDFEGELEVTFSDGAVQTVYDFVKFTVREQFE
jgi:hypothetical protein